MRNYSLVKVMSESLVGLDHVEYDFQLWSKGKVRKVWKCRTTAHRINKGDEAWLPVTNASNRMHRISNYGMAQLLKELEEKEVASEGIKKES